MGEHIEIVTPPVAEPITIGQAREHMRFYAPLEDDTIAMLIVAARKVCETLLKQTISVCTFDWFLDGFPYSPGYCDRNIRAMGWDYPGYLPGSSPGYRLKIPGPPLISVESVSYVAQDHTPQVMDPLTYHVSTGWGRSIETVNYGSWPATRPGSDALIVRYTAGRTTPDEAINRAILFLVTHWFENRDTSVTGTIVSQIPDGVDLLLASADHGSYS